MATFEKFDPQQQIHGLALAAAAIRMEQATTEERNFQECMEFFRSQRLGVHDETHAPRARQLMLQFSPTSST